ncbi:hypothetical protein M422DRAFT_29662 [Sphaerobolus stellatus SS14]|uniref:Uncharacterized protein n=1 Tax=Sphaerobolus stellatus (strain SS14) TaxID=990650 RepID=A0A0C9URN8_SPHS4|nr:hypothetical protein M422DRAFT_29662 [Sphaerobolus stellatus SS14]
MSSRVVSTTTPPRSSWDPPMFTDDDFRPSYGASRTSSTDGASSYVQRRPYDEHTSNRKISSSRSGTTSMKLQVTPPCTILATGDFRVYQRIFIGNPSNGQVIRENIFVGLLIADNDQDYFSICREESPNEALTNEQLADICSRSSQRGTCPRFAIKPRSNLNLSDIEAQARHRHHSTPNRLSQSFSPGSSSRMPSVPVMVDETERRRAPTRAKWKAENIQLRTQHIMRWMGDTGQFSSPLSPNPPLTDRRIADGSPVDSRRSDSENRNGRQNSRGQSGFSPVTSSYNAFQ